MKLSNKWYDTLKALMLYVLPALEFLTATLTEIWDIPYGGKIAATIAALATAIGIVLGISSSAYKKNNE